MSSKRISGLALFILLLLGGIGLFYYLRFIPKKSLSRNLPQPTQSKKNVSSITGEILNIVEQENVITINTSDNDKIYVAPVPGTEIISESGKKVDTTYLKRGFIIKAVGVFNKGSAFFPDKISVAKAPNVIVFTPVSQQVIDTKFQVTGIARVFENVISLRIKHTIDGKVYSQNTSKVLSKDVGEYGQFNFTYNLEALTSVVPSGDGLTLEVYQASAKDGSDQDLVSIPLIFQKNLKNNILTIQLYFSNPKLNNSTSCENVYPVERQIAKVKSVGKTSIEELIKGPSSAERTKGYTSILNSGTKVNKLIIEDGVAKIDFTKDLEKNSSSTCKVQAIRAQIAETLLQFPTVSSVEISVEGKKSGILNN